MRDLLLAAGVLAALGLGGCKSSDGSASGGAPSPSASPSGATAAGSTPAPAPSSSTRPAASTSIAVSATCPPDALRNEEIGYCIVLPPGSKARGPHKMNSWDGVEYADGADDVVYVGWQPLSAFESAVRLAHLSPTAPGVEVVSSGLPTTGQGFYFHIRFTHGTDHLSQLVLKGTRNVVMCRVSAPPDRFDVVDRACRTLTAL